MLKFESVRPSLEGSYVISPYLTGPCAGCSQRMTFIISAYGYDFFESEEAEHEVSAFDLWLALWGVLMKHLKLKRPKERSKKCSSTVDKIGDLALGVSFAAPQL